MRIFKNRWFVKFAKKEKISDDILFKAIKDAHQENIDADLGSFVIKQRLPKNGRGKSGGYRTIIIFKKDDKAFFIYGFSKNDRENIKAFFIYGFSKNDRENITDGELDNFKDLSKNLLSLSNKQITKLIENKILQEITDEQKI